MNFEAGIRFIFFLVKDIYGEPAHSNEIKGVISSRFLQNNENILF